VLRRTADRLHPSGHESGTSVQVAGTYQWDASYSGDGNNNVASDNNDPGEVVTFTAPGQLAFGSGWYTIPGVGQTSFGFVVAQVPQNTYWDQLKQPLVDCGSSAITA
jgi:hypothetical protein